MELESVTLKLPRELLSGAQRVATARDVTIGHMVRVLLKREVERQLRIPRPDPDPKLVAALQVLLTPDIAAASDWGDLTARLRPHGYELQSLGGALVLVKSSCGTRMCKASELGTRDSDLVERFGAPVPANLQGMPKHCVMPAGRIDDRRGAILSAHIQQADSWANLIARLAEEGMEMRALGAGLGIYIRATGRHLCNTETLGAPYDTLLERYGAPLPEKGAKPNCALTSSKHT